MIYFWDYYRNSEIFDETFAVELLNMLRKHGEFTANRTQSWNIPRQGFTASRNGIVKNIQPTIAYHCKSKKAYNSGVHKEHSPAYHYLVMKLFIDVNLFNIHYGIENKEISNLVDDMQEFLLHIAKQDGTVPMVGDSFDDRVMGISQSIVPMTTFCMKLVMEN